MTHSPVPFPTDPGRWFLALQQVTELNTHNIRKEPSYRVPYIAHLMEVAALLMSVGAHEDVVIAALHHDTLEDHGDKMTFEALCAAFGDTVARIVLECSDAVITTPGENKAPWKERKQAYLAKLSYGKPHDTLLVVTADKISNVRSMCLTMQRIGPEATWALFKGGEEGTKWYFGEISKILATTWPENPLLPLLLDETQRLLAA